MTKKAIKKYVSKGFTYMCALLDAATPQAGKRAEALNQTHMYDRIVHVCMSIYIYL